MLAERMNTFSGSPTSALIAKVAELRAEGKDIISLNVGEPDFGTPDYIKCGAIKAIVDNFSKYTAGNGLILSGTEFSIDDSKVATQQELEEIDIRLTAEEQKNQEQDNRLTVIETKDLEQDGRLTELEYRGTNYRTEIITTVASYYEEPYKAMGTYGTFDTTHHLRTNIGNYTIRDGIVFITIHRYVDEIYDGRVTIIGMFDEGRVSGSGLEQEHIVEMKTISSGNVKIHCELLNNETQQQFIIYNVPNDSNEKYEISVHGFNFVPQQVLVPYAPMVD